VPDDYDTRLETMDIEGLTRLRLKVFERHDLVLAKLCRNIDRDREDVVALALALVSTSTSCGSGTKRSCGRSSGDRSEKISPCGSGLTSSKSFVVARDGHGASSDSSGHSMLISNDVTAQGFTSGLLDIPSRSESCGRTAPHESSGGIRRRRRSQLDLYRRTESIEANRPAR
jgi:hypothetical protein